MVRSRILHGEEGRGDASRSRSRRVGDGPPVRVASRARDRSASRHRSPSPAVDPPARRQVDEDPLHSRVAHKGSCMVTKQTRCCYCSKVMQPGDKKYFNRACCYNCGVEVRGMERKKGDLLPEDLAEYESQKEEGCLGQQVRYHQHNRSFDVVSLKAARMTRRTNVRRKTSGGHKKLSWKFFLRYMRQARYSSSFAAQCWDKNEDEGGRKLVCIKENGVKKLLMPVEDEEADVEEEGSDEFIEPRSPVARGLAGAMATENVSVDSDISDDEPALHNYGEIHDVAGPGVDENRSIARSRAASLTHEEARVPRRFRHGTLHPPSSAAAVDVDVSRGRSSSRGVAVVPDGARSSSAGDARDDGKRSRVRVRTKSPAPTEQKEHEEDEPRSAKKKCGKQVLTVDQWENLREEVMTAPTEFKYSEEQQDVQMAMKAYIEGFGKLELVENRDVESWLEEKLKEHGHTQMVKNLHLGSILDDLKEAKRLCQEYSDDLKNWTFPICFDEKRTEFLRRVDLQVSALNRFRRVEDSIKRIAETSKSGGQQAKAKWRSNRDKWRFWWQDTKNIDPAVAKHMADVVYCLAKPPGTVNITFEWDSPSCKCTPEATEGFGNMWAAFKLGRGGDTWLEQRLFAAFKKYEATALAKSQEVTKAMSAPNAKLRSASGTIGFECDLKQPGSERQFLTTARDVRQVIWCSWIDVFDGTIEGWPYRHLPLFLTMYAGRAIVIMVAAQEAEGLGEPDAWVKRLKSGGLDKCNAFLLEAGDSMWIPPCSIPIVVGISKLVDATKEIPNMTLLKDAEKKLTEKEYIVAGIWPMFDVQLCETYKDSQIAAMNASWHRAQPFLPKSWAANDGVKHWNEKMMDVRSEAVKDDE